MYDPNKSLFGNLETTYDLLQKLDHSVDFYKLVEIIKEKKYNDKIFDFNPKVIDLIISRSFLQDTSYENIRMMAHFYWYLKVIDEIFHIEEYIKKCNMCLEKRLKVVEKIYNRYKYKLNYLPIKKTANIRKIIFERIECDYCRNPPKIEFKVNNNIILRLENKKTNIYVNNIIFNHCKYLVVKVDLNNVEDMDNINSIDDIEKIDNSNLFNRFSIDPETEFWGHCSNLQAWAENDYDTRLLHSNLSFPLLKKLYEIGDPVAKKVFKEEIANRFNEGNKKIKQLLIDEDYINISLFTIEELEMLLNIELIGDDIKGKDLLINMATGSKPLTLQDIEYIIEHNIDYSNVNDIMYIVLNTVKKINETICISCKRIRGMEFRKQYKKIIQNYRHLRWRYETMRKKNILLFNFDEVACKNHSIY